ncbi:MAG: hypothetical protein QNK04_02175 [Myxococcota bacterium]|nr:hypothetical protein [Myxococcota bacterium]
MHRSLVPFLFFVLALAFGGIAQAGQHEEAENPCAAKAAEKVNPCDARAANPCGAKDELPSVDSDSDAAEAARERATEQRR